MMPRQQSLKCVETVLFLGLFILVGHLAVNFWERYVMHNEVNSIKFNLYKLKESIIKIGKTYDILQSELSGIIKLTGLYQAPPKPPLKLEHKKYEAVRCKDEYTLDRRKVHGIQIQAALKAKAHDMKVGSEPEPTGRLVVLDRKDKHTGPLGKNVTTITRYPLKSVGVASNISKYKLEDCLYNCNTTHDTYRCYRPHDHWIEETGVE